MNFLNNVICRSVKPVIVEQEILNLFTFVQ